MPLQMIKRIYNKFNDRRVRIANEKLAREVMLAIDDASPAFGDYQRFPEWSPTLKNEMEYFGHPLLSEDVTFVWDVFFNDTGDTLRIIKVVTYSRNGIRPHTWAIAVNGQSDFKDPSEILQVSKHFPKWSADMTPVFYYKYGEIKCLRPGDWVDLLMQSAEMGRIITKRIEDNIAQRKYQIENERFAPLPQPKTKGKLR